MTQPVYDDSIMVCPGAATCTKGCRWGYHRHDIPHWHTPACDRESTCPGKCRTAAKPESAR